MKKLNRKGFTLIELMAVIAILIIIMGIALPNITSSIERSKQKQNDAKIKLIESAAELYCDRYSCTDTQKISNGINVSTIIIDQEVPGVKLEDVCDDTSSCCVKYDTSKYKYTIVNNCANAS